MRRWRRAAEDAEALLLNESKSLFIIFNLLILVYEKLSYESVVCQIVRLGQGYIIFFECLNQCFAPVSILSLIKRI